MVVGTQFYSSFRSDDAGWSICILLLGLQQAQGHTHIPSTQFFLEGFEVRLPKMLLPPVYVVRREDTVFTGICLFTPEEIPHLHPIIFPLVPGPFLGGYPSDWSQVPSQEGVPQSQIGRVPPPPSPRWLVDMSVDTFYQVPPTKPGQDRGVPQDRVPPSQGWGPPPPPMG